MKHDLFFFRQVLKPSIIKKINKIFFKSKDFTDLRASAAIKTAKVSQIPYKNLKKYFKAVEDCTHHANIKSFGFDIYSWLDQDPLSQNIYEAKNNGQYTFHTDCNSYTFKSAIKLTTLINLSEKSYEGGQLELFLGSKVQRVPEFDKPGDVVVFKADIPHRVTPVTRGVRITSSIWTLGPWWR